MTTKGMYARGRRTGAANVETVIELRRPNGHPIVVNGDLIETVETAEDGATVVTLTTGNTLVVTQTPEEVRDAVVAFRRQIASPPS
jgi:flagellar protein FlbD